RGVVGLLVGVWVARYLGPEQFGLLSYAQSFVLLFGMFATLGLDGFVVRELIRNETRRDTLLGTAFVLKLLGVCMMLVVITVVVFFTRNDKYTVFLVLLIAASFVFQSLNVIDFYFQAKVLSKYVAWINSATVLLSSVIKIG